MQMKRKEKTELFSFYPGKKLSPYDNFTDYIFEMKSNTYTPCGKLICERTDEQKIFDSI